MVDTVIYDESGVAIGQISTSGGHVVQRVALEWIFEHSRFALNHGDALGRSNALQMIAERAEKAIASVICG